MLKVCHIISGDLWAGAEVMSYHLLKGLMKYGDVKLLAIVLNEGRLAEEIRRLNIPVHTLDETKKSFLQILRDIKKIVVENSPDVIHSHRYKENILAYLVSRSIHGLGLIGTQHGMPEVNGEAVSLKHRLITKCNLFLLSRYFDRVVGVSHDIRDVLIDKGHFREGKVRVIHNGIEIPETFPDRSNSSAFVIGSSGRLFPIKDYPFMVEIAKKVLGKTDNIRFQLAGDGPERSKIQALIESYGLNGTFELKGHVENVSAFYRGLDLYLNTSIHEGIPLSVLEAMANGLPVVAPKVGGLTEIFDDGVEGYLIRERDPAAFAEKCLLLYEDNLLRRKMSQAARERVKQSFSVEKMVQQYYNLYVDTVLDHEKHPFVKD